MKSILFRLIAIFSILFISQIVSANVTTLQDSFINPPDSAKSHTGRHWMNGNVTKKGITADLEAMAKEWSLNDEVYACGTSGMTIEELASASVTLLKD